MTLAGKKASVVVLGDIGRSPRMCNHAVSMAEEGMHVRLIGYPGSNLPEAVATNPSITVRHLTPFPKSMEKSLPRILTYFLKVLWNSMTLFFALPLILGLPDFLLMQNPPSIPAMFVCYFYARVATFGKTQFLVDWHNYGYSILALALKPNHFLVKFSKKIEAYFGPKADAAFCVTEAMKEDLEKHWGVKNLVTLYDRAPAHFRSITLAEKHSLMARLGEQYPPFINSDGPVFTEEFANGRVEEREDRPALLISSTSWTPDEDFSVLLDALVSYEEACNDPSSRLPDLICVITGKGPQKAYYANLIREKRWRHVQVVMPWLEPEDYPLMLASADLGVCLHTSSSGLDLPMKVVDMFGCGLPVCALDFPALPELVQHGKNGLVFKTSEELSNQIVDWFKDFPSKGRHKSFVENIKGFQSVRWGPYWREKVVPVLENLS